MWFLFFTLLAALMGSCGGLTYNNVLRGVLSHNCPNGEVLSEMTSAFSDAQSDRQWKLECKPFPALLSCTWSGLVGSNGTDFDSACPANHVIRGVYSEYQPEYKSRKWNFECCSSRNVTIDCQKNKLVNYWKEDFKWSAPGGNYIIGISAGHKGSTGDQRWSYTYCRLVENKLIVTSQILAVNGQAQTSVIQGDVPRSLTRNAAVCSYCKWPQSNSVVQVPYTISSDFSTTEHAAIVNAMRAFSISTCVDFVPRTNQSNYLSIVKEGGCWSYVGRQGEMQKVSLGNGCIYYGIIQHELIHALNFWHEHSRSDRDQWVQIHFENIIPGDENNFDKLNTDNLGVEYDYSSVMHYGAKSFSVNNQDTITALDPSANIGQRVGMTENDILKINKFYNCSAFLPKYGEWDNELGNVLSVTCRTGHAVSRIKSSALNSGDRLWRVSCKAFHDKKKSVCQWSPYLNKYKEALMYKCSENNVIAGIYSTSSSVKKDRRWKVQCCRVQDFITNNCKTTSPVNYWNEAFEMPVASGNYLTGISSVYDSKSQDRQWTFTYCQGEFL